jgi:hypothetical protein
MLAQASRPTSWGRWCTWDSRLRPQSVSWGRSAKRPKSKDSRSPKKVTRRLAMNGDRSARGVAWPESPISPVFAKLAPHCIRGITPPWQLQGQAHLHCS